MIPVNKNYGELWKLETARKKKSPRLCLCDAVWDAFSEFVLVQ
jgi:hypothetical protein